MIVMFKCLVGIVFSVGLVMGIEIIEFFKDSIFSDGLVMFVEIIEFFITVFSRKSSPIYYYIFKRKNKRIKE